MTPALVRSVLILGGARSGKSAYAQRLAEAQAPERLCLATAVAGDRLVVLTRTERIQVYNVSTVRPGRAYGVPAGAQHLAAGGGIAADAAGTKLHVLRLTSGRSSVVATAPKAISAAAAKRAVAYAYNVFQRLRNPPRARDVRNVGVISLSTLSR